MNKNRLEAFSDGVLAIVITIMVLEIKVPHETSLVALRKILPIFLSYVLSFIYIGIYWNNHHHLLQSAHRVNGKILWANLHWLFWMSLIPFGSGWMGENRFENITVTVYGLILFLAAVSYFILVQALTSHHGRESSIFRAVGKKTKEKISVLLYFLAALSSLWLPWIALSIYVLVALMWLYPDSRIETVLKGNAESKEQGH